MIAGMFRGKYLDKLKKYHDSGELSFSGNCTYLRNRFEWTEFIDSLYAKKWCPFVKETFNGNGNAMAYLARYAYRTAISNSRITSVDGNDVSFSYTDYADHSLKKTRTVSGPEFIRLFLQHILPQGFHRVRFSGYLSNCRKSKNLKHIHRLRGTLYAGNPAKGKTTAELLMMIYNVDINKCPCCQCLLCSHRFKPR